MQGLLLDGALALYVRAGTQDESLSFLVLDRRREHCRVGHPDLDGFSDGLLHRVIVAESLPLGIHRVDTPARKDIALANESLPVDLVLVLLARVR